MPVRVRIPIRLRVDRDAIERKGSELERALSAALGRALANSSRHVVEPRGRVVPVVAKPPTFTWGGPGLPHVTEHVRRATEAKVAHVIETALRNSGLLKRSTKAPEVLPAAVSEKPDRERLRVLGYLMPSYGGEDDQQVPFDIYHDDTVEHPEKYNFDWISADLADFDPELIRGFFLQSIVRERGSLPTSGYFGAVIYSGRGKKPKTQRFVFPIFDFAKPGAPDLTKPDYIVWGDIGGAAFDAKHRTMVAIPPAMPTRGEYQLLRQYPLTTNEQKLDLVHDYLEDQIRDAITASPELNGAVEDNTKQAKQLAADALPKEAVAAVMIGTPVEGGKGRFAITLDKELELPPLPVTLYPLNIAAPLSIGEGDLPEGKGKGKGQGQGAQGKGGQGKGGKGKEGKGDEHHEGGDDSEGGFIVNPNATGEGKAQFAFPPGDGDGDALECVPFEDEPPVDQWKDAEAIKRLIRIIAGRLRIPECQYPGRFCINAAKIIGGRATAVAKAAIRDTTFTSEMKPTDGFIIKPVPTLAVQFLRHLGGTVPYMTSLQAMFFDQLGAAWTLHFRESYAPALRQSIGWVFMYACQVAFLQQLRYSRTQIDLRVEKFDKGYADFFQETVLQLMTDVATLGLLREQLVRFLATKLDSLDAVARAAVDEWRRAHREVDLASEVTQDVIATGGANTVVNPENWEESQNDLLGLVKPIASATGLTSSTAAGTVAKKHGEWAIRDTSGRLWTLKELDTAIALQQGTAESVDPLVKQILDVDGVVPLFKANPWMIKVHLKRLLQEMQDKNDEITGKVTDSATFAFEKGPISEDIEHATVPYCKYALGGIHLAAHALIYDAFQNDPEYAEALNDLFDTIQGWREIKQFFIIGGILILAVLCPEAAAVVGILQAEGEREDAAEMKDIYRSLIDPEIVISKAELEVQQFMAELMLAVSIIPEAGNIIKGATGLTEAVFKGTVKEFAKEALESILKTVIKQLQKNLVAAFVKEIVVFEVFGVAMQTALAPLAKAIEEEAAMPQLQAPSAADLGLQTASDVLGDTPASFDELPEYDVGEDD